MLNNSYDSSNDRFSRRITSYNVCYTKLLRNRLGKFNNLKSALEEIKKYLDVPMKDYETKSKILKSNQRQVTLDKFF